MGPQNNTEQPVLLGFNADKRGNGPGGPLRDFGWTKVNGGLAGPSGPTQ